MSKWEEPRRGLRGYCSEQTGLNVNFTERTDIMNIHYELEQLKNEISRYEYKTIVRLMKSGNYKDTVKNIERLKINEKIKN